MSDTALRNAEAYLAGLKRQISNKKDELVNLNNKLAQVEAFIAAWHSFSQNSAPGRGEFPHGLQLLDVDSSPSKRPKNLSKERIGDRVASIIEDRGQPVPRNGIFAALENDGVILEGTDPKMVLSTMLWRLKSRFVRLKGHGYWFVDRDYVPAGYKARKPSGAYKTTP